MREILVDWATPAGGGFRTVTYWEDSASAASQRAALGAMLGSVDAFLDSNAVWLVETSGRELDEATGTLTGVWSEATAQTGAGALAGQCVPDAAHVLLRWNTSSIVGGRFVKGRSFIPGLSTANVLDGNLALATVSGIQTALNTFVAAAPTFGVWHRPDAANPGTHAAISSATVWNEFAVLRRRRG